MVFYIDLEKNSINQYKKKIKTSDLIPSRMILLENIDRNFTNIKKQELKNVNKLLEVLKTKDKVQAFADQSGVSLDYLNTLGRELRGYRQLPNRIKDFPNISERTVEKLEEIGMKNALHLFEKILTPKNREDLSKQIGIDQKEILKLTRLVDLSRIRWVNHTFANVLLEAGYDTAEKVAQANPKELFEKVKRVNEEKNIIQFTSGCVTLTAVWKRQKNCRLILNLEMKKTE
jgi:hypothetical protein